MDNSLIVYIERLELMAFFAGYPLIYALVYFVTGKKAGTKGSFANRLVKLLPYAYALSATLFLGLLSKNMYPDYSLKNITEQFQTSYLRIFGLLAILFWIPAINKKNFYSLLHSLVFFFFLLKDLILHNTSTIGAEVIKNDMKIYTDSLLLNIFTFAVVVVIYFIFSKSQKNNKPFTS